ncbi:zinc ribbon domain-containing protein [Ruminococcus sp.]|uniref:zinc ribbon domain-containing protein n=1 Tax=Ruminococcus sp. TaxID=41978 RepID=UPI0025CCAAB9|nr:zinc ribbon domain-containing protein [Ruminococcus sp.]
MPYCYKCGSAVKEVDKFCFKCGISLKPYMSVKCTKCGSTLKVGNRFCGKCGYPVKVVIPNCSSSKVTIYSFKAENGKRLCPYCEGENIIEAKVCINCLLNLPQERYK